MDWIHCNSCFRQPNENGINLQFYLTSCGHMFCENCCCFADGVLNVCKVCRSDCSSAVMGEKLFQANPQVQKYFQESETVCEKLIDVMKFQKAHRIKLIGHHQQILSKYNKAKTYIKKLENELKIAKKDSRNTSQSSCNYLTLNKTQSIPTPIIHSSSTPFKMINAEANIYSTPSVKQRNFDLKQSKQSFLNELSMLSSRRNASEFQTPSNCSSIYPLSERYVNNFT